MLKVPLRRRAVDPEVDDILPTLSVSSRRDWATDGTAELSRVGGGMLGASRLLCPVLGDNANDCRALFAAEAVFEDMASTVVQGLVVARMKPDNSLDEHTRVSALSPVPNGTADNLQKAVIKGTSLGTKPDQLAGPAARDQGI